MAKTYLTAAAIVLMTVTASGQAWATTSCSSWKSTCFSRCAGLGAQCKPNCEARAKVCRQTGCFYAAAEGKQYCSLKKN